MSMAKCAECYQIFCAKDGTAFFCPVCTKILCEECAIKRNLEPGEYGPCDVCQRKEKQLCQNP